MNFPSMKNYAENKSEYIEDFKASAAKYFDFVGASNKREYKNFIKCNINAYNETFNVFLTEINSTVLYLQLYQHQTSDTHFRVFLSLNEIDPKNVLLVIFSKRKRVKLSRSNFYQSVNVSLFFGTIENEVYYTLLSSSKPIIDNFSLDATLNQEYVGEIIKCYSEYEFSLIHLQRANDINCVKFTAHPLLQTYCENDPNWEKNFSDFRKENISQNVMKEVYQYVSGWTSEMQRILLYDIDLFECDSFLTEHAIWKNKDEFVKYVVETFKTPPFLLSLKLMEERNYQSVGDKLTSLMVCEKFLCISRIYNFLNSLSLKDLICATNIDDQIYHAKTILTAIEHQHQYSYSIDRLYGFLALFCIDFNRGVLRLFPKLNELTNEDFGYEGCIYKLFSFHNDFNGFINSIKIQTINSGLDLKDKILKFNKKYDNSLCLTMNRLINLRDSFESYKFCAEMLETLKKWININSLRNYNLSLMNVLDSIPDLEKEWNELLSCLDLKDFTRTGQHTWQGRFLDYKNKITLRDQSFIESLRILLNDEYISDDERIDIFIHFTKIFTKFPMIESIYTIQNDLIEKIYKFMLNEKDSLVRMSYSNKSLKKMYYNSEVAVQLMQVKKMMEKHKQYMYYTQCILGPQYKMIDISRKIINEFNEWKRKNLSAVYLQALSNKSYNLKLNNELIFKRNTKENSINDVVLNYPSDLIDASYDEFNAKSLGFVTDVFINAENNIDRYKCCKILEETLKTFYIIKNRLSNKAEKILLALYLDFINVLLLNGIPLTWNSVNLHSFTKKFNETVVILHEKSDIVLQISGNIQDCVSRLEKSEHQFTTVKAQLDLIKEQLGSLGKFQLFNIEYFVQNISDKVENILLNKLRASILEFRNSLLTPYIDKEHFDRESIDQKNKFLRDSGVKYIHFDIRAENDDIKASPSLTNLRLHYYQQLDNIISVIVLQDHLLQNFINFMHLENYKNFYKHLFKRLTQEDQIVIVYKDIERIIRDVESFVQTWMSYQVLWDVDFGKFSAKLNTIQSWVNFYRSFNAFKLFRSNKSYRIFPLVVIRYKLIKSHVDLKHNEWNTKILTQISSMYQTECIKLKEQLEKSNIVMKNLSTHCSSLSDIVSLLSVLEAQKQNINTFYDCGHALASSQQILSSNNYQVTYLCSDLINSCDELKILNEKYMAICETSKEYYIDTINQESFDLIEQSQTLLYDYTEKNICNAILPYEEILEHSAYFENKFKCLLELLDNTLKAKKFLEILQPFDDSYNIIVKINSVLDDLAKIRLAWKFVQDIDARIEIIGSNYFKQYSATSLTNDFETIIKLISNEKMSLSFKCLKDLQNRVIDKTKMNCIIAELKADFFKERHWKILFKKLNKTLNFNKITLKEMWELDFIKNELIMRDVFNIAQGEFGLENYLNNVQDYWSSYKFTFSTFREKHQIVNNWGEIVSKLEDDINGLDSMRLSPYYKNFSITADQWQNKLCFLFNLFEIWMEVQRKFIYLHSIFCSSSEISKLLKKESNNFNILSKELDDLCMYFSGDPLILNVFQISEINALLDKLNHDFGQIQKSLSKYLEKERDNFPRFYFVGDDDLIEILGSGDNVLLMQKHFKKMFAGVASVQLNQNLSQIITILSREGEHVNLHQNIDVGKNISVISWLKILETNIATTLAHLLRDSFLHVKQFSFNFASDTYLKWIDSFPQQLIILSEKILWCDAVQSALVSQPTPSISQSLAEILKSIEYRLEMLPFLIEKNENKVLRCKMINLITNLVYFRDKTRQFISMNVHSPDDFLWLSTIRYHFDESNFDKSPTKCCLINIADATFYYGFEYQGLIDYIIQTPLIDNCFLVLTQALKMKLGGSPFGPAGTGKTESVKALGAHLGRYVIVFNCDSNFDFQAMGRIFIGLCRVGSWGCFDEFNRLEERIISAVSEQIHAIQLGLKEQAVSDSQKSTSVELLGRKLELNPNVAIFITMNPDYAGRSRLPNNLKCLFRSFAMTQPDRLLIAQIILYSQGFTSAENLASKIVPLLRLCAEQLSQQIHYDFGLRALKTILTSAGNIKRQRKTFTRDILVEEEQIMIRSVIQSIVPKLTFDDSVLIKSILNDIFTETITSIDDDVTLIRAIKQVCEETLLEYNNEDGKLSNWVEKIIELHEIIKVSHGIILVGKTCTGKSSCWQVLLEALTKLDGIKGHKYVIDPKAINKDMLYGNLDENTREWNDGILTSIIRNVVENLENDVDRHWIILDGDIDPEWVENLNSTLDDNKLLTLPNGERLSLPPNVRIIFEVSNLDYATPATISRCGMIFFTETTLSLAMVLNYMIRLFSKFNINSDIGSHLFQSVMTDITTSHISINVTMFSHVEQQLINLLIHTTLIVQIDLTCKEMYHCMEYNVVRCLQSFFIIFIQHFKRFYNDINDSSIDVFIINTVLYSLVWAFGGDSTKENREKLAELSSRFLKINPIDYNKFCQSYIHPIEQLTAWDDVDEINSEVDVGKDSASSFIVLTREVNQYFRLMCDYIHENRFIIFCGPRGSGKSILISNLSKKMINSSIVVFNLSSNTESKDVINFLNKRCEYKKELNKTFLTPKNKKVLLIHIDEINIGKKDMYGTQSAICLLRQLIEYNGFYANSKEWIRLDKIKFVASCNLPTDIGRHPLMEKFQRHTSILYIDYPTRDNLNIIFRVILTKINIFKNSSLCDNVSKILIDCFEIIRNLFTINQLIHYQFSPKDITQWILGVIQLIDGTGIIQGLEQYLNILIYEGTITFGDRLVSKDDKQAVKQHLINCVKKYYPEYNHCIGDNLYTNWFEGVYELIPIVKLQNFISDEIVNLASKMPPLYLNYQLTDLSQTIYRTFTTPEKHLIIAGKMGSGRKLIIQFVSLYFSVPVFKLRWSKYYTLMDFYDDLRTIFLQIVTQRQNYLIIIDEASSLPDHFYDVINTILTTCDVIDLYPPEQLNILLPYIKKHLLPSNSSQIHDNEKLLQLFYNELKYRLHLIFIYDDEITEWTNKYTKYPIIFKSSTIKWLANWSPESFIQVALQMTAKIDITFANYQIEEELSYIDPTLLSKPSLLNSIIHSLTLIHTCFQRQNLCTYENVPTPQKYIQFLHMLMRLINEKVCTIQEDHSHISTGLIKLQETFQQVDIMKSELSSKKQELQVKNNIASEKLSLMATEQQNAQIKKQQAQKLFAEVKMQAQNIQDKSSDIKNELSLVEPALEQARDSLAVIDRNKLNEIKHMHTPSHLIKLAIGAVYELITGGNSDDWKLVRQFISKDDFIQIVRNFKTENISNERRQQMAKFLNNEKFTFEHVSRGSVACAPLVKWVKAHIDYHDILNKIEPLNIELKNLETQKLETEQQAQQLEESLAELEIKIEQYKLEYSTLIREIEQVKTTLQVIEHKVNQSETLLSSLQLEQQRWSESHNNFQAKKNNIIGNCILSAAFLVYFGNFDVKIRDILWCCWEKILISVQISFDSQLYRVEYLSTPNERCIWIDNQLPDENLSLENATILKYYNNNFSLIIDPSKQATNYICNMYRTNKPVVTTFLNTNFKKQLESAIRFGHILLINNAEYYDPIICNLVEKNTFKIDNRTVITIGTQQIDLSPTFKLFLITHNSSYKIPSYLLSHMTTVNFTITFTALQNQCLTIIFRNQRPDLELQRTQLTKLQHEYIIELYNLQKELLLNLNQSQTALLDDDRVINTLKQLNSQTLLINSKVLDSENHLSTINSTLKFYKPLASLSSSIYFMLQDLSVINSLYQFSLSFFFQIFSTIFENVPPEASDDPKPRLQHLTQSLLRNTADSVLFGLIQQDKPLFLLLLSKIYLESNENLSHLVNSIEYLFMNKSITIQNDQLIDFSFFPLDTVMPINRLLTLPQFSRQKFKQNESELYKWSKADKLHTACPIVWNDSFDMDTHLYETMNKLLLAYTLCASDCHIFIEQFLYGVLGSNIMEIYYGQLNLSRIVFYGITPGTPIILLSVAGYDPSSWINDILVNKHIKLKTIAMGSSDACHLAHEALIQCSKEGKWLALKNIHLASHWIKDLEKVYQDLNHADDFRLFLTAEITSNLPSSILRSSRILTFEPPPGVKSCLHRAFYIISPKRFTKIPSQCSIVYFLLAWIHSLIIERLRYSNLGWSKKYEFTEADLRVAFDMIDSWLERFYQDNDQNNFNVDKLPWNTMKSLLSRSIYGSYIENEFDSKILNSILDELFKDLSSVDSSKVLVSKNSGEDSDITVPAVTEYSDFIEWINRLPQTQTTYWLKLPKSAESLSQIAFLNEMVYNLLKIHESKALDQSFIHSNALKNQICFDFARHWLNELPRVVEYENVSVDHSHQTLARFYSREFMYANKLLSIIRDDLTLVSQYKEGKLKINNYIHDLISAITSTRVPQQWLRYTVPTMIKINSWIEDFLTRLNQLFRINRIIKKDGFYSLLKQPICVGKFFFPDAFATATRQYTGRILGKPLQTLQLKVSISDSVRESDLCLSLKLTGLKLRGALIQNSTIITSEEFLTDMPIVSLEWIYGNSDGFTSSKTFQIPVYLDSTRKNMLFVIDFPISSTEKPSIFYQHGVAVFANQYND